MSEWPTEIHCHDKENWFGFPPPHWNDPDLSREPYGQPFRDCSYCGGMHPEDLIAWIEKGATLHGADWKYGWPHKFYVESIPNPHAGKLVVLGGESYGASTPTPEDRANPRRINWKIYNTIWVGGHDGHKHECWSCDFLEEAPAHVTAEFKNAHLDKWLTFSNNTVASASQYTKEASCTVRLATGTRSHEGLQSRI